MRVNSSPNNILKKSSAQGLKRVGKNLSFKGFSYGGKSLFAVDLDGSFALNLVENLNAFKKLQKELNAVDVYISGRNIEKLLLLKDELAAKGVRLPDAKQFVGRNGLYIFKNKKGQYVVNEAWEKFLSSKFNPKKVLESVKEVAFSPEYYMPGVKRIKGEDFTKSKICQFEFWPSPKMVQFICDSSIADTIEDVMSKKLKADGLDVRVLKQNFHKSEWDRLCMPEQLALVRPRFSKGTEQYGTQLDIMAANKADGLEFVNQELKIPVSEVVAAGNDENDISLAELTLKGYNFVGVGNSSKYLKNRIAELLNISDESIKKRLVLANGDGLAGIVEGINKIKQGR